MREHVDAQSRPWLVAVGMVLILLLLAGGVWGLTSSIGSGDSAVVAQVVVPRMAGRTAVEAQTQLERLGLLVEISFESNELIPPGTVVSQNPISGSRLEVGQLVTLVVSDGPAGMEIPDVKGLHSAEAITLLQTVGLRSKVEEVYDDAVRIGEAVGSVPATGARAAAGTTVVVRVSKGPAPRTVPKIVGASDVTAMAEIARAELKVGKVTQKVGTGQPAGTVISASPEPGAQVPRNMPVNLVIARDPATIVVPDVVGLDDSVAGQVLRDAGLSVSARQEAVPMGDSRNGLVVSQSPIAGTALPSRGAVTVQVAVAPDPPPPPAAPPTAPAPGASGTPQGGD